jgi:hypothetical protein
MSFDPTFFGAVVKMGDGDARIMCMAQRDDDETLSIHFFKVDTTLQDTTFNFPTEGELSFSQELRGTGLAVALVEGTAESVEEIIVERLKETYGDSSTVSLKQIDRPSLVSLFM